MHTLYKGIILHELDSRAHEFVDVRRLGSEHGLSGEIEQALHDRANPLGRLSDGGEVCPYFLVYVFSPQEHVRERENARERVVNLVSHPRRKPPDARLLFRLEQPDLALYPLSL